MLTPTKGPIFLPPIISSPEVQLAVRVLKRKWAELSVEAARELKQEVIRPCLDQLKYTVIECVRGIPIDDGHFGNMFLICLRMDEPLICLRKDKPMTLCSCKRAKYKWLLQAFQPDPETAKLQGVTFRIHVNLSKVEMNAIVETLEPFEKYSETGILIHSDWSYLPPFDVLKDNWKSEVTSRNAWAEWRRKFFKENYPKKVEEMMKKDCDVEWKYNEICDTLGIKNYPEF